MNSFTFVGTINPVKDKDNFKGYESKSFPSGWKVDRIRFNVICGDDRHLVELSGGCWNDASKNVIYTLSKGENGKGGEKLQVKWDDRMKPEVIDKIAPFKKVIVDLEEPGKRAEIEKSGDETALAESKKRRKEFISEVDAVAYVHKLVNSEKIKGIKFKIQGNISYTYSQKDGLFYRSFTLSRIYRAAADAEVESSGTMDLYFSANAVDADSYDDDKKYFVKAYTQFYDNNTYKKNVFCPVSLVINGTENEKKALGFKKQFEKIDGDEVKELGVTVKFIDGAQRRSVTIDDLTDEQKENIEFGLTSLEEINKELNNGVYGDRITETSIVGLSRGYSGGPTETAYTVEDFELPSIESKDKNVAKNDDVDLFADDDDDLLDI